jgi:hypothetical protein
MVGTSVKFAFGMHEVQVVTAIIFDTEMLWLLLVQVMITL